MRLKSIKLAGFKSFVDPTTVNFPSNLCAVVGPNGCGKSNIIDAVRWVMGESSARNLRGQHMTDVIFNGSSSRKPVGQASVELVFDNSDRTIKGEYAAFNEIAVRRILNSDAQSTYMLNGTKCRRRDITDIFLGTGLGPRSYSIIEQGMVSRLIESKPEELRVFIEEAAGISKYKERRRETENRIKRTRENLERLSDIRDELERQLQHLQRQSKSAEKYKEYKQEERDSHAQLNAVRWTSLDKDVKDGQALISELEIKLEACVADYRAYEADIEKQRADGSDVNERYQNVQATFYSLGGDISRVEQNIEHQKQRQQQLAEDLRSVNEGLEGAQLELEQDVDKITNLDEETSMLEPELESARAQETESGQALEMAEEAMTQWQQEWDIFNNDSAESTRNAEVEQQRIKHLENIVERGVQRKSNLKSELEGLGDQAEVELIQILDESIAQLSDEQDTLDTRNKGLNEKIENGRQGLTSLNNELNNKRSELQSLLGRQSSLDALQKAALGKDEGSTLSWLENNNLSANPRLVDDLKVDSGWDVALETVLGQNLQAVCVENLDSLSQVIDSFSEGQLNLVDTSSQKDSTAGNQQLSGKRLLDKVKSSHLLGSLLDGIYCAESLEEALTLRGHLGNTESIICRQGIWLGGSWLRVTRGFDEKAGMIQRQDELSSIGSNIEDIEILVNELVEQIENEQIQLVTLELEKDDFLQELGEINRQLTELSSERSAKLMKVEQENERQRRLSVEIGELEKQLAVEQENISTSRVGLQEALDNMEVDTAKREELLQTRDAFRSELDSNRQKSRHDKDHTHQLALRHQTLLAQLNSLKSVLDRVNAQVNTFQLRQAQLEENLQKTDDPLPALKQELEEKLASRVEIESQLNETKARVDNIEHDIRQLELKRNEAQGSSQAIRDDLANGRLSIEGATIKRGALEEQLKEASYDLQAVLNIVPEGLGEAELEQLLERLANRIQRLGPINLAAIDEYATQSERKTYLDKQDEDLVRALVTLENAIKKIDRETRTRFKETFDKINNSLQELFPKVFGGGHAYLDMSGDDLLNAGVSIMARPPGKRNSTIHLLSGGEKAMTAIALVFSIFRLNPSPFCILDEVDAPLDDANVGRYNNLVKEMSDRVQFIFITHNRLTMEIANQLLGVTMHEPGVSRMVAVDVDEAAEMAAL